MKLSEKMVKQVLKEEYDKRISYFLNEKIAVKDKRGINVLQYAKGLKVLDNAGNQYTLDTIINDGDKEYVKLFLPEEPREDALGSESTQSLKEEERGEVGFYSRGSGLERDISPVEDSQNYLFGEEEPLDSIDDDQSDYDSKSPKLLDRTYILVPMGEFEERFRLKIEED